MDRAFAGYALLAGLMVGCFTVILLGIGNYIAAQAAQPTVTTSAGPPQTTTVTPGGGT